MLPIPFRGRRDLMTNNIKNDANKYISQLDSERFGIKTAKLNTWNTEPSLLVKKLKNEGVSLVISKVGCNELDLIHKLEDLDFKVMDFQVTYTFHLERNNVPEIRDKGFHIREATEIDTDEIVSVAEKSFENYGHYAADKKLDVSEVKNIYMDWMRRSCVDKKSADVVIIAEDKNKGKIAGVLAFKKHEAHKGQPYVKGVLGAVLSEFRGRGVFKAITIKGLQWGKENRCIWAEHNVLTTNYPVNRSFSTLGFCITDSFVTLHGWI